MTQPTQAQIEAADRLAVKIVTLVADRISKDGKLYAYDGIEAAREARGLIAQELSAATQVGEPTESERWRAVASHIEATTIERCAQVADEYAQTSPNIYERTGCRSIATAIRKLKDEHAPAA